jgi:hypothetical protein
MPHRARDAAAKGSVASFRAAAAFMIDTIEQQTHVRELVGLAR